MHTPLTGAESQTTVNFLQEQPAEALSATQYKMHGYHHEGKSVAAWDNTSGTLRTKSFNNPFEAFKWLYES